MNVNRYASDSFIGGKILGVNRGLPRLRDAIANGTVATTAITIKEGERLDTLAGRYYGDGRLWWVIAAASNIGWWLQVPPGTVIVIPTDIGQVMSVV